MHRINIPAGTDPLNHIIANFGNAKLSGARQQFLNALYFGAGSSLTPREREAVRMPIALNIGCHTCLSTRMWRDLPGFSEEIEEAFYTHAIAMNLEWEGFSPREKFLLELSDRFEHGYETMNDDDDLWERAHALLPEQDLGDAFILMATWVGLGHTIKALGGGAACDVPDAAGIRTIAQSITGELNQVEAV